MIKIGEEQIIHVSRGESHFDRATETAAARAIGIFGMTSEGHSKNVENWERSCCGIEIRFEGLVLTMGMGGAKYTYTFVAKTTRNEDEDDEE